MEDLLTTRQVQDILKVDRITIYRMLTDGRIRGVKVGQQWRFPQSEVERIVRGAAPSPAVEPAAASMDNTFPTHCIQTVQDLFAEVGQVSALMIDINGAPVTEASRPCRFCQLIESSPSGKAACVRTWQQIAHNPSKAYTCHAGLHYLSAPVLDNTTPVGTFLTGQFYLHPPAPAELESRLQQLAETHALPITALRQAAASIRIIPAEEHTRLESGVPSAAHAIHSILQERTTFLVRLQQIAHLTRIG